MKLIIGRPFNKRRMSARRRKKLYQHSVTCFKISLRKLGNYRLPLFHILMFLPLTLPTIFLWSLLDRRQRYRTIHYPYPLNELIKIDTKRFSYKIYFWLSNVSTLLSLTEGLHLGLTNYIAETNILTSTRTH